MATELQISKTNEELMESLRHEPDNLSFFDVITSSSYLKMISYIWIPFLIILIILNIIKNKINKDEE